MIAEIIIRIAIFGAMIFVLWRIVTSRPFRNIMLFAREKGGMISHVFKQDNMSRQTRKKLARYMKQKRRLNDEIG